jgi:hypothetical protein
MYKLTLMFLLIMGFMKGAYISQEQYVRILFMEKYMEELVEVYPEFDKFKYYMPGIYLRESSIGNNLYGDMKKKRFYYIHQGKKIYITNKLFSKSKQYKNSNERYIKVKYWGKYWTKKIRYDKSTIQSVTKASLGAFMLTLPTTKLVIKKNKYDKYNYLLKDDLMLVNKILNDLKFSMLITLSYLNMNYKEAVERNLKYPIARAISRHNGGWNNWIYVNKVKKDTLYVYEAMVDMEKKRLNHITIVPKLKLK